MYSRVDFCFDSIFGRYLFPLIIEYSSNEEKNIIFKNIICELRERYDNVRYKEQKVLTVEYLPKYISQLELELSQNEVSKLKTYNWEIYSENDKLPVNARLNELIKSIKFDQFYENKTLGVFHGKKSFPVIVLEKKKHYEDYKEPLAISLSNLNKHSITIISQNKEHLLEYTQTQKIPGSIFKVRIDKKNTATLVKKHAHIFDLRGNELYAVNFDGTSHDGNEGKKINTAVANFLTQKGFILKNSRLIEKIEDGNLSTYYYTVIDIDDSLIVEKLYC